MRVYFLPVLSGLLIGTSYIPFPPWAIFFCYVPLWIFSLKQKSLKKLLIGAWICQFIMALLGFNWVAYSIKEFGFLPWPVAILGLFAFAALANLHIPISLFFWFITKKYIQNIHSSLVLFMLPLYAALCMDHYPMIFEWNLGYTWLYAGWSAVHTAEIWGFRFLSTLTIFSSLFALSAYLKFVQKKYLLSFSLLFSWFIIFIGLNIQGHFLQKKWSEGDEKIQILMIQPNNRSNISAYQKKYHPQSKSLYQLIKETEKYFKKDGNLLPDLIVWPEGAYPYRIKYNKKQANIGPVKRLIKKWQSPLLIATSGIGPKGTTNSIFIFDKEGDELVQEPYHKSTLLAFGEYFPGEDWLPISRMFSYYGRAFIKGNGENKVTTLNKTRLGLQICYEGIFDSFTRELALEGAQILVNVATDHWYGTWQEPWQHLYMTLARTIEVRRPMVRGTNTGISSFISTSGKISYISKIEESEHRLQEVSYFKNPKQTIFTLWGIYINLGTLWIVFLGILGNAIAFSLRRSRIN